MNPIKLAITLPLALAAAAVPALAQAGPSDYGYGYGNGHQAGWDQRGDRGQVNAMRSQLFQLDRQIDRGEAMRRLTQREAFGLRTDLKRVDRELAFATRGGLSRFEMRGLQQRIDFLRFKLDRQLRDFDRPGYGGGYGYDNDQRDHDQRVIPVQALPRGR